MGYISLIHPIPQNDHGLAYQIFAIGAVFRIVFGDLADAWATVNLSRRSTTIEPVENSHLHVVRKLLQSLDELFLGHIRHIFRQYMPGTLEVTDFLLVGFEWHRTFIAIRQNEDDFTVIRRPNIFACLTKALWGSIPVDDGTTSHLVFIKFVYFDEPLPYL